MRFATLKLVSWTVALGIGGLIAGCNLHSGSGTPPDEILDGDRGGDAVADGPGDGGAGVNPGDTGGPADSSPPTQGEL